MIARHFSKNVKWLYQMASIQSAKVTPSQMVYKIKMEQRLIRQCKNQQEYKNVFVKHAYVSFVQFDEAHFTNMIEVQEKYNLIDFSVNLLGERQKFTDVEKRYAENMALFWYFVCEYSFKQKKNANAKLIQKVIKLYNHLLLLLQIKKTIIFNYIRLNFYCSKLIHPQYPLSNKTFLRIVFDKIQNYSWPEKNINFFMSFATRSPLQYIYYQKSDEIRQYFLKLVSQTWFKRQEKYIITVLNFLLRGRELPQTYKSQLLTMFHSKQVPSKLRTLALKVLINFYQIDTHNINTPVIQALIQQQINVDEDLFFRMSFTTFYYKGFYLQEYWLPFFQWISKKSNHQHLTKYHLFCLYRLFQIEKDVISPTLISAGSKFFQALKQKQVYIQHINIKENYNEQFVHSTVVQKNSCQNTIANCLRLANKARIEMERPIQMFIVDILINGSIVVQVNSPFHYKLKNGVEILDIKSNFRSRILKKLGYTFKIVNLSDVSEANYNLIEKVYKLVEQQSQQKK